jgi:hypothetical protein
MSASIVLTRIVRGYKPNQTITDKVIPEIPVDGSPITIKTFGPEMYQLYETLRAKYADSNIIRVEKSGEITVTLEPRDAVGVIDKEHEATKDLSELESRAAKKGKEVVILGLENHIAGVLRDPDTYPTGNKVTLSGTSQWNDLANSTPIEDVFAAKKAISGKVGVDPQTMIIPLDVFETIIWHNQLKTINPLTGQYQPATIETLKARFGLENIVIGKAMYYDKTTSTFNRLWEKDVVIMHLNQSPTPNEEDVSMLYRFRQKGYPYVDEHEVNKGKVDGRRYNDKVVDVVIGPSAGYLIKAAIA